MKDEILRVDNLEKSFPLKCSLLTQYITCFGTKKRVQALEDVNFRIKHKEIMGVIGPNGAGKTTLLRIVADLLEADEGEVTICGRPLNKKEAKIRTIIGYVPSDDRSFFWRLTGRQNLRFFARLYAIPGPIAAERIQYMVDTLNLKKYADRIFGEYSTGTRKKFALIRALLHKPKLLLLDEVTNSLDPISTELIKSMVRKRVSADVAGIAAMWCTHRLEEISQICDKVLVLDGGKTRFLGNPACLKLDTQKSREFQTTSFKKNKTETRHILDSRKVK